MDLVAGEIGARACELELRIGQSEAREFLNLVTFEMDGYIYLCFVLVFVAYRARQN